MSTPDELLDWTIGPAPPLDEQPAASAQGQAPPPPPPPARAAPPRPRSVSRRTRLFLLGLPVVLVLLLTLALPQLETWRTRRAVEQVIAQQEQARLSADWPGLRATYADPSGWAALQVLRLRSGWFPWPISLVGLQSGGPPGHPAQFQVLGPQLVRADVVRAYVLADGTRVSFAFPQYYQFAAPPTVGAFERTPATPIWRQVAPPGAAIDQLQRRQISGARVDVIYYPADAEYALSLAHDLDAVLARACLDWDCPAAARVRVRFNADEPPGSARSGQHDYSLFGSLTFQAVVAHRDASAWREISLPTRLVGGYPADAPAAEAVRRAAAVQALLIVARQVAPRAASRGGTALLDALVVREGVRLGLEPARLARVQIANPLFDPGQLWSLTPFDIETNSALPEALALLNQLLVGRGLADERQLLRALGQGAPDIQTWLASNLGLAPADVDARLNAALNPSFPPVQRPNFLPDLALSCPAGPVLANLAGQTAPLLVGDFPDSSANSWSSDGNRLALTLSGRLGIVNYSEATGQFVPEAILPGGPPVAWASPTVLVYTPAYVTAAPGQPASVGSSGPTFFDAISRARTGIPDYDSFWPSPDRRWAVLGSVRFGGPQDLAIIPNLGGPGQRIGSGFNPTWSPDSQTLVFARSIQGQLSLIRYDVAGGLDRVFVSIGDSGVPNVTSFNSGNNLIPAWSPSGDQLAVAVTTKSGDLFDGWVGLMAADGSGLHMLAPAQNAMQPFAPSFSADGRYLAVVLYDGTPRSGAALYSAAGGLLGWYPGLRSAGWSPAGHILALAGQDGISLLRDPAAAPEPFGSPGCSGVAWRAD